MLHHLRAAGVSVLLDARGTGVPRVVHWGRDLGDLTDEDLAALADATVPAVPPSSVDHPLRVSLVPGLAEGWSGRPTVAVHRPGGPLDLDLRSAGGLASRDEAAGVAVETEVELTPQGVLRLRQSVRNEGSTPLAVDAAAVVVPVPDRAREVLDFSGLWSHERRPQRHLPPHGVWSRESRHGRPGHDDAFLLTVGVPGFGFRHGEVWAAHVAWSGDSVSWLERSSLGVSLLGGGELLAPGEVTLAPGETYTGPWTVLVWSDAGLDGLSDRLHPWIRSWSTIGRPRPLVLNTWEAVYFDHSLERLEPLVDAAAAVGVERFVLDDGWFRGRDDDTRALGDWFVDLAKWPDGLTPLIDRVTGAGMEFGLWVEPEMVNPDSDLARSHPQWLVGAGTWRHQRVLDLTQPAAYAHVRDRLDALLTEYPIAYLKWDHNRDLLASAAHGQTIALYALLAELRADHPSVEIESCASGGGRIDLGILPLVDRVWTSDTNDPLERQSIQRWTGLVIPPEYLGSHLGAARAHTTGRTAALSFRLVTALFGHAGIEWDLTRASADELAAVTRWTALYRSSRALLHGGVVVRGDASDPAWLTHGVVATDRSEALFAVVALGTAQGALPPVIRLPGLDPSRTYRVSVVDVGAEPTFVQPQAPPWWPGTTLPGRVLAEVGLAAPLLAPENAVLLRCEAV
ncbi:alpha-galactosidase [Cellulomonas sp. PhB150]|uniref:alpha-galactosidase n=1 Tax=Cellulomonas sp. PhB150 TaxID=2485188 RepID=UPI000FBDD450|nr:alpha-galactosidase [Cellulomonas sp. PhB150]ROS27868.1 alpha-galactosidase [Cellulomonas sp. PhB150]